MKKTNKQKTKLGGLYVEGIGFAAIRLYWNKGKFIIKMIEFDVEK